VAVWKSLSTSNTLRRGVVGVRAAQTNEVDSRALTGVIFEPFREVQSQLVQVPTAYSESLARQRYDSSCEAAINEQIKYAVSSPPPPSFVRAVRNISTSSSTQKGWNQGKEKKTQSYLLAAMASLSSTPCLSTFLQCGVQCVICTMFCSFSSTDSPCLSMFLQCGVQCVICIPCTVCLLRPWQCGPSRFCEVSSMNSWRQLELLVLCYLPVCLLFEMASSVSGTLRSPVRKSESMLRSLWSTRYIGTDHHPARSNGFGLLQARQHMYCCRDGQQSQFHLLLSALPFLSTWTFSLLFY
jgi:hypothetical protein